MATRTADEVLEILENATEENKLSSLRSGQVVNLPAEGDIWISGDIHDHRRNFEKFVRGADLDNNPQRHIVLHELIHGDHVDENGAEGSWEMLVRAAELKCDHPGQVHFLLANHDLAQIHGEGIMKGGVSVCEAFNKGIKRDFGDRRGMVQAALTEHLLSYPLAIRTGNGLWISHSVPQDEQIDNYDYTVFDRAELKPADYARRTGPVYQIVWGRRTSPAGAEKFAERVGAQLLISGHQPQEAGYAVNGDKMIIIASDHNQGVFLRLPLSQPLAMTDVVARITRFVAYDPEG